MLHAADLELVQRVLRAERSAVDELVERLRCVPRILAAKNAQLGGPLDEHALSDLTQETLGVVWEKLGKFEGRGALESWVYRFCFLQLMHSLRRARRIPKPDGDLREKLESSPAEERGVDILELERVYALMDELRGEEAEAVRAKNLAGESFEQIAERLGAPVNTIKTRYYRGILKLRERLASHLDSVAGEVRT